ncbi:MAG: hypothetical protein WAS36_04335 [Candidatus Saccharimonadales bacterium]
MSQQTPEGLIETPDNIARELASQREVAETQRQLVVQEAAAQRAAVAEDLSNLGIAEATVGANEEPKHVSNTGGRFGRGTVPVASPGPQALRQAGFMPGGARFGVDPSVKE